MSQNLNYTSFAKGFVYCIGNASLGLYKIGFTRKSPQSRFREIQNCSPVILVLIGYKVTNTPEEEEYRLHQLFASKREHGEWFKLSQEDIDSLHFLRPAQPQAQRADTSHD